MSVKIKKEISELKKKETILFGTFSGAAVPN